MVNSDFGLCASCWHDTPFIGGTVCDMCGVPLPGQPDGELLECDDCIARPRSWVKGRAALLYRDRARDVVLALKHGDRPEVARTAGLWLARAGQPLFQDNMVIAPVPLHPTRLLKRRYNQSALLVQALARETGLGHCPDLLVRRTRTAPLDGKSVEDRFSSLSGTISPHQGRTHRMAARSVLLVDDVMTSGATLAACAEACHAGGATQVFVLVLARVAKDH